jgi:hypothetical protein
MKQYEKSVVEYVIATYCLSCYGIKNGNDRNRMLINLIAHGASIGRKVGAVLAFPIH